MGPRSHRWARRCSVCRLSMRQCSRTAPPSCAAPSFAVRVCAVSGPRDQLTAPPAAGDDSLSNMTRFSLPPRIGVPPNSSFKLPISHSTRHPSTSSSQAATISCVLSHVGEAIWPEFCAVHEIVLSNDRFEWCCYVFQPPAQVHSCVHGAVVELHRQSHKPHREGDSGCGLPDIAVNDDRLAVHRARAPNSRLSSSGLLARLSVSCVTGRFFTPAMCPGRSTRGWFDPSFPSHLRGAPAFYNARRC